MLIVLGLFILAIHGYFLWSLGAGFYYDSLVYAQLAEALFTKGGLEAFYSGPRYYIFQHLAPGLSLFWGGASLLGGPYAWLLFATAQHLIAVAGLLYVLWVWRPLIGGPFLVGAAFLISCHPLYQSLHNRLMTESITGSMLLIGLGAASSILLRRGASTAPLVALTSSAIIAIQFRSQSVLYFVICFLAVLGALQGRAARAMWGACLAVVVCSVFLWPVYRLSMIGQWFLPNTSYLSLTYALRFNIDPSLAVVDRLKELSLPANVSAEKLKSQGIDFMDAAGIGESLRRGGMSDAGAKAEVLKAAWAVRTDSPAVVINQLRIPLLSIGVKYPVFLGDPAAVIHRGFTNATYARHVDYWEQWEGGTLQDDYAGELDTLVTFSKNSQGLYDLAVTERFERSLRPFLVTSPVGFRDPLSLIHVSSDLWLIGWFVAACRLWRQYRPMVWLLVAPVGAAYLMSVTVPVGNPRYAYPFLPIYILSCAVALEYMVLHIGWRKSERLMQPAR